MAMSKEAQLEHLRLWTLRHSSDWMSKISYVFSIIFLILAFKFHLIFASGTFLFLMLGLNVKELGKNMKNAIKGLENNQTELLLVKVEIDKDSESDGHNLYVCGKDGKIWEIYFRPAGWTPKIGEYEVKGYYYPNFNYPVLIETEEGWIYPVKAPKIQEKLKI